MMMRSRLLLLLLLGLIAACVRVEVRQPEPRAAISRYASPTGTGSACTTGSPCTVQTMLSQAVCGDTLILKDGTYTGNAGMLWIQNATNYACTVGAQMTVQAENDGGALIDGEYTRDPVQIYRFSDGNQISYWNFSGFNARRSANTCTSSPTAGFVVNVRNSDHINFRRIVVWDVPGNCQSEILIVQTASDILIEDVGIFGVSPYIFLEWQQTQNIIFRRVWARHEGTNLDVTTTAQAGYNNNSPDTTPPLWENVILTTQASSLRGFPNTQYAILNAPRDDIIAAPWLRMFGMILYPRNSSVVFRQPEGKLSYPANANAGFPDYCTGTVFQDWLLHANGTNYQPLLTGGSGCEQSAVAHSVVTRVTSVRGTTASNILPATTITPAGSFKEQTTLAATGFDWMGGGDTARLCYRYVGGAYTSTKLWPWPMDERIKAAIATNASAGSQPLLGVAGSGYTQNTVTSEIVAVFGSSIPSACNQVASGTTPNPPAGLTLTQLWRSIWTPLAGIRGI